MYSCWGMITAWYLWAYFIFQTDAIAMNAATVHNYKPTITVSDFSIHHKCSLFEDPNNDTQAQTRMLYHNLSNKCLDRKMLPFQKRRCISRKIQKGILRDRWVIHIFDRLYLPIALKLTTAILFSNELLNVLYIEKYICWIKVQRPWHNFGHNSQTNELATRNQGGRFKNAYELLNLRVLKIPMSYKNCIF